MKRLPSALLKRALGYSRTVEKIFQRRGGLIRARTTEHVTPDVKSAEIWLRSHMPAVYGRRNGSADNEPHPDSVRLVRWWRNRRAANGGQERDDVVYRGEESCRIVKTLVRLGASDQEISEAFGFSISTLKAWCDTHLEFSNALHAAKEEINQAVESALVRRAIGYSYSSERVFCRRDGTITKSQTIEHVAPDVNAANTWLRARRPDLYRNRTTDPTEQKREVDRVMRELLEEMTAEARAVQAERVRLARAAAAVVSDPNSVG